MPDLVERANYEILFGKLHHLFGKTKCHNYSQLENLQRLRISGNRLGFPRPLWYENKISRRIKRIFSTPFSSHPNSEISLYVFRPSFSGIPLYVFQPSFLGIPLLCCWGKPAEPQGKNSFPSSPPPPFSTCAPPKTPILGGAPFWCIGPGNPPLFSLPLARGYKRGIGRSSKSSINGQHSNQLQLPPLEDRQDFLTAKKFAKIFASTPSTTKASLRKATY